MPSDKAESLARAKGPGSALLPCVADVGGVLACWFVLLSVENVVSAGTRAAGHRLADAARAQLHLVPVALAALLPCALLAVVLGASVRERRRLLVSCVAGLSGAALAYGLSFGRHFESVPLRVTFVGVLTILSFAGSYVAIEKLALARPRTLATMGLVVAASTWLTDKLVLPRLYPAFHVGLFVLTLLASASAWIGLRETRWRRRIALGGLFLGLASAASAAFAARKIQGNEPLRAEILGSAPLLSRAVEVAMWASPGSPPTAQDPDGPVRSAMTFHEQPRTLDWSGKDILLVTIDALRADHLGTYGYGRPTSPNIDRLAARGVRFDHAYSPVPNTSYSLVSLMTGKYMRPLLTKGVPGADRAETWANHLQRLGYVTGGIFPPAVFYVDTHHFRAFEDSGLGFAHVEESYAEPPKRRDEVVRFLASVPPGKPAFAWVHIFEPHEPYVVHPEFPFDGHRPVDAYDSEIAASDALVGEIVQLFDARKRGPVIILTADHGEAFGEHGSLYHSSDVYDEQVRVPMIVVGPGVRSGQAVEEPVQTIDLLATTLSALGVRRPKELRGRDLGARLTGQPPAASEAERGFAFAETEQQSMVAQGTERLLCLRTVKTCALFDLATDPLQQAAVRDRQDRADFLKRVTWAVEEENSMGSSDLNDEVALAMSFPTEVLAARLDDPDPVARLVAALALAARRDARAVPVLLRAWQATFTPAARSRGSLGEAREVLAGLASLRAKEAVPLLLEGLDDVALRGSIVKTLHTIGDASAAAPIFAQLQREPYRDLRNAELEALLSLGMREELGPTLERFATLPDPMVDAIAIADRAHLLQPDRGGVSFASGTDTVKQALRMEGTGPARLFVLGVTSTGALSARVDGKELPLTASFAHVFVADLPTAPDEGAWVNVELKRKAGIRAVWIMRVPEGSRDADEDDPARPLDGGLTEAGAPAAGQP